MKGVTGGLRDWGTGGCSQVFSLSPSLPNSQSASSYHRIFSGERIGPSVQLTMNGFSTPAMTHPRHAPKPQPIAASVENCEGRDRFATIGASAANMGIGPHA